MKAYTQQEVLLGRNNMYEIIDRGIDTETGQVVFRAKMIPNKSELQSIMNDN